MNEQSELFRSTVTKLVEKHRSGLPGVSPALWSDLVELGLTRILLSEAQNGAGGSIADVLAIHQTLGAALAGTPYLPCTAGSFFLSQLARDPDVGLVTLLLDQDTFDWCPTPIGKRCVLPFADLIPQVIGLAPTDTGASVFLSDTESLNPLRLETTDPSFPHWTVETTALKPSKNLGEVSFEVVEQAVQALTHLSRASLCAEMLGASEHCLENLLEFLMGRKQFGQAIGTFQAVKHKTADIAIRLEGMRAFRSGLDTPGQDISDLAKAYCSDSYRFIAETATQLYGGIGFTWEHEIHWYLRHAQRTSQMCGTPAALRQQRVQ